MSWLLLILFLPVLMTLDLAIPERRTMRTSWMRTVLARTRLELTILARTVSVRTVLARTIAARAVSVRTVLARTGLMRAVPVRTSPARTVSVRIVLACLVLLCAALGTASHAAAQDAGFLSGTDSLLPAQTSPHDDAFDAAADEPLILYIPDKMISGTTYHGMALVAEPQESDTLVSLVTMYDAVQIPGTVVIPAGRNHGIFEITPKYADQGVTVYAVTGRHSASASSALYPGLGDATDILIMSPGYPGSLKTSADVVPLHIFLVDGLGKPARAKQDTAVYLSSDSSISFSKTNRYQKELEHVIKAGEYYDIIYAKISESGTVHASSGSMHGSLSVEYGRPQIEVKFALAPDIAMPNSAVYYYIWLERDGRPYAPAEPIDAYLTIQDEQLARFPQAPADESPYHDYIINGIARGMLQAGSPASASPAIITASVPGIGSASAVLAVGYHASDDGILHSDIRKAAPYAADLCEPYCRYPGDAGDAPGGRHLLADSALLWVYPNPASEQAWGVLGGYRTAYAQDAVLRADLESAKGIDIMPGSKIMIPAVFEPDAQAVISSNSASAKHVMQLRPGAASGSAMEFPLNVRGSGSFTVSAHGANFEGVSRELESKESYASSLSTRITRISQDAAIVSIVDESGYVIDASSVLGEIEPHSSSPIDWKPGRSAGVMSNFTAEAFVHLSGVQSSPAGVSEYDDGLGVDLWMPGTVHSHEEFPVAVHAINLDGEPLRRLTEFESMGLSVHNGRAAAAQGQADVMITSGGLFDAQKLRAFDNDISQEISLSFDRQARLGDDIVLDISTGSVPDPLVKVQGSLDFKPDTAGRYIATPKDAGQYDAKIRITGDGWSAYEQNIAFEVREYADVSHAAFADSKTPIPVQLQLDSIGSQASFAVSESAPIPHGAYHVAAPAEITIGPGKYEHIATALNGANASGADFLAEIDRDTILESAYRRVVDVRTDHIYESELQDSSHARYGYGDAATIAAPWKHKSYGLVWLAPAQWSGVNPEYVSADLGSASFAALEDHHITVLYEENYIVLIAAAAAASTALAVPAWKKFADIAGAAGIAASKIRSIRR